MNILINILMWGAMGVLCAMGCEYLVKKKKQRDKAKKEYLQFLIDCKDVCNRIYIARNISLNEKAIHEELKNIDRLLAEKENFN